MARGRGGRAALARTRVSVPARRRGRAAGLAVAAVVAMVAPAVASPAGGSRARDAAGPVALVRVGAAAKALPGERPAGALPAGKVLSLGVALRLRDPTGLAAYAQAVVTPGSAAYHHYLRPSAIAARFGPTRAAVAALVRTLRRDGLRVGTPSANDLVLPVSGSAGRIEAAFHTRLDRYVSGATAGWAAERAPRLPAGLATSVAGVLGLNDLSTPHSMLERAPSAAQRAAAPGGPGAPVGTAGGVTGTARAILPARAVPKATSKPTAKPSGMTHGRTLAPVACGAAQSAAQGGGGWTDQEVAKAYGLSGLYAAGDYGAGQTIALYELEPFSMRDLATFDRCYFGVSHTSQIRTVGLDGFSLRGTGSGESLLDIEDVSALAPAARILVYEAPNTTYGGIDAFNAIVSQDKASIISTSWGECEAALQVGAPEAQQLENTLFQEAAAQGQTVFAASGDTGSDDCASTPFSTTSPAAPYLSVDDPASQPFVVGVGGTTLMTGTNPPTQTVWNDGAHWGGSGGGVSNVWPSPSWQADSGVPGVVATARRQVPDVSATADEWRGITVYSTSFSGTGGSVAPGASPPAPPEGWTTIGGTSSAAPTWAAVAAEIAGSSACATLPAAAGSSHDLGFIAPELYQVAGNPAAYATSFSDVRKGTNDVFGLGLGYHAGPGFDLATGLGSPLVTNAAGRGGLDASLCAVASAAATATSSTAPSVTALSPASGPSSGGTTVTITGTGFPAGDPGAVTVAFGGVPATVASVPTSTSLVVTAPAATLTPGAAASANAGPVQVTVTVHGATSRPGPGSVFDEVAPASPAASGPGAPTVAGIGPSGVNVAGGATVTVYGNGFSASDPPTVTFGGIPATGVQVRSTSQLTAVVPAESSATQCATGPGFAPKTNCQVEVVVTDSAGSSPTVPILPTVTGPIVFDAKGVVEPTPETEVAPAATELDYAPTPTITSVAPDPGDATGQIPVVIRGSGFSFNTLDWVNFGPPSSVLSEQVNIATLTPTEIVIAPPAASSTRSTAAQPLVGGVSVQTAGGLSNVYPFSYAGVPSVRHLAALGGPSTGGTRLKITGANLAYATVVEFLSQASSVGYGASATIAETARTATSITVTTPADLPGPVDVLPCTATACAQPDPARDTFVYFSPAGPRLATMRPRSGPAQGGTRVTLFGDNLNGAVAVEFGHHGSSVLTTSPGFPDGDPYVLGVRAAAGRAGTTVPVTVVTRGGRSRPVVAGRFHYKASPPSAPRAVTVHVAASRARLSWAAPLSDGGRPITGYRVLALAPGVAPVGAFLSASARSYTFPHLAAQHTYVLRVAAVSALGRGLWAASAPKDVAFADNGYLVASSAGGVEGFGSLVGLGGVGGTARSPVVAIGATSDGGGYWLVQRDGAVTAFGDAATLGFPHPASPIVAMAVDESGGSGYWLLDARGHVYAYGTARNLGSLEKASSPAVGIAATPDGHGYWIVAADGAVTAFGSATAYPGAGQRRSGTAVAITARAAGSGYWVLSADGTVRAYGKAVVLGSPSSSAPPRHAVALAATGDAHGYWILSADGTVTAYGDAHDEGHPSFAPSSPAVGIATG